MPFPPLPTLILPTTLRSRPDDFVVHGLVNHALLRGWINFYFSACLVAAPIGMSALAQEHPRSLHLITAWHLNSPHLIKTFNNPWLWTKAL